MPTVGSLFSGIGGFELGMAQAGFETLFQVEIDGDAVSVLERHYPDLTRYRDIREVSGHGLPAVDVLVGGFPCQDLSVAGARAGLAGERSGLFFEIARLARELAPTWLLLENVPGLLSSFSTDSPPPSDLELGCGWESDETSDLGVVLDTLSDCGYGWAYRTLDARFFGVPQRRRRVFIVGCLGDSGVRPAQVLFESDSSPWDPAPGRAARQEPTRDAQDGTGVPGVGYTLRGNDNGTGASDNAWNTTYIPGEVTPPVATFGGNRTSGEIEVATAVNAHGGPHGRLDFESETFVVADTVRSHPRPGSNSTGNIVAAPLTAGGHPNSNMPGRHREDDENVVPVEVQAFNWQAGGGQETSFKGKSRQYPVRAGDYSGALSSTRHDAVAYTVHGEHSTAMTGDGNAQVAFEAEIVRSLDTTGGYATNQGGTIVATPPAVAFHLTQDPINGAESRALGAGNENGCATIGVAVSENQRAEVRETDYSRQITTGGGKPGQGYPAVRSGMAVRRLTPRECERLQGFPDDWSRWRVDGSEIADGPRYRLIGNAVATPVIRWIARRLRTVMEQA